MLEEHGHRPIQPQRGGQTMADIYMRIDGVRGESMDAVHKDWIEVLDFNHAITQAAQTTSARPGTARCQHADYTITKYVDLSSPKLYEACSVGNHFRSVTLEMM